MNTYTIRREASPITEDDYLAHFGVKGQKWGVRRYQNLDGSYKSGAEGRYNGDGVQSAKRLISKGISTGSSKTASLSPKRSSGGGGGTSDDKTSAVEKITGQKITVHDVSEKKAQTDKKDKDKKGQTFKINDLYSTIDGLELDTVTEAQRTQLDNLIGQYRAWKTTQPGMNKKMREIENFISEYELWKSKNPSERTRKQLETASAYEEKPEEKPLTDEEKKKKKTGKGGGVSRNQTYALHRDADNSLTHWGIKGMRWGVRRYQNEDGSYTEEGKRRKSKGKNYSDDYWNAHDKKDPKYMSDKELQQRINRLNNEKQYKALTKTNGEKTVDEIAKYGKKIFSAAVGAVIMNMAVDYGKEHVPEIINAGKDFVEGSAWMMSNLMKKM